MDVTTLVRLLLMRVHPLVCLLVVVACGLMIRRKVDTAVWLLLLWGMHGLTVDLWNAFVEATYFPPGKPMQLPPEYINVLSGVCVATTHLVAYSLALYATWRFWRATRSTVGG